MRRGDVSGCGVAVKTFNKQALRDVEESVRQDRFLREVNALKTVGARSPLFPVSTVPSGGDHFVKLLGYSKCQGFPGVAPDGAFYTILELGEDRLDQWLKGSVKGSRKVLAEDSKPWLSDFAGIARALFSALHHLHSRGLVHMDVKPENIMQFGSCWKLIDLECCMPIDGSDQSVSADDITPLYASPELAKAVITASTASTSQKRLLPPSPAMDIWAAGAACFDIMVPQPKMD